MLLHTIWRNDTREIKALECVVFIDFKADITEF